MLRNNDSLVQTVVCKVQYHIAPLVTEMLLFQRRISKRKAQRYSLIVERFDNAFYKRFIGIARLRPSAVPKARRKYAVKGGYLHPLAKEIRTILQHFHEHII